MIDDLKSWPFVEARKVLAHTEDKDVVTFATGYGPSGLPHIGTFGEVARTTMVINAFRQLSDKPVRLIVFSDDMDALRKVPENVPQRDILEEYIGVSLSSVENPFDTEYNSFSAHNNAQLCAFLDAHDFDYEFMSSTDCYEDGDFNDTLKLIAERADEIKEIVTKDYGIKGGNRKETYCPFIPIVDHEQHFELESWNIETDSHHAYLKWQLPNTNGTMTSYIGDGNVKCQWKVDWPMRWIALGVDYEMHGKDLIGSAQVGQRICKLLGQRAPINYMYELFLDEDGEKISKSKGNGLDLHDWMHYSTPATISYYMFQNPRKSRKLHFGVIPQMTDDYLKMLDKYNEEPSMDNPVWHVHRGDVPSSGSPVSFSMLLNLVSITDTQDPFMLRRFVQNYAPDASFEKYPMLRKLIAGALNYYELEVLPNKVYRAPTDEERVALISLYGSLRLLQKEHEAAVVHLNTNNTDIDEQAVLEESITSLVYEVGKHHFGEEKDSLRNYFKAVYEVVMGQPSGPRLPVFIMMLGIEEFLKILKVKIQ